VIPAGNYIGEVLAVNPAEYSVQVKINHTSGIATASPITATPLAIHGGSSDGTLGMSMPEIGSVVYVSVPSGSSSSQTAYILGYAREPSRRKLSGALQAEIDPAANMLEPSGYFRGSARDDVLPGDFFVGTASGSRVEVSSSGEAGVYNSGGHVSVGSVFGKSYISSKASESYSEFDLLSIRVTKEDATISANVSSANSRNLVAADGKPENDTTISIGNNSAFKVEYTGASKPAIFSISKSGEILIRGSKVVIDSDNKVAPTENSSKINGDLTEEVTGDYKLIAGSVSIDSKGNYEVKSGGNIATSASSDVSIYAGGMFKQTVSGPSLIKQGPFAVIPGLNDGMIFQCDSGSAVIKAGSIVPGTSTIAKPQIRLEADSGGDILLQSAMTPGGAMLTGSIVMSSPLPASATGAGGAGNYGIVLNSPLCMLGNYPSIELTPPNIPNLFLPPIPVVSNEPLAKAIPVTAALAALAALLTAYPPTAPVGAAFSAALATTTPLIPTRSVFGL